MWKQVPTPHWAFTEPYKSFEKSLESQKQILEILNDDSAISTNLKHHWLTCKAVDSNLYQHEWNKFLCDDVLSTRK